MLGPRRARLRISRFPVRASPETSRARQSAIMGSGPRRAGADANTSLPETMTPIIGRAGNMFLIGSVTMLVPCRGLPLPTAHEHSGWLC
jgi:hypothetical protein